MKRSVLLFLFVLVLGAQHVIGQSQSGPGDPAWLAYRAVRVATVFPSVVPETIVKLGDAPLETSAAKELVAGWHGMLGREAHFESGKKPKPRLAIILGTQSEIAAWRRGLDDGRTLAPESYRLYRAGNLLVIEGGAARGVLYGTFALLRDIAEEHSLANLDERSAPYAAIRWVNQWDNPGGGIERGYGGASLWFAGGKVRADLSRASAYARLLASIGINGCTINNVNSDPVLLKSDNIEGFARVAAIFRAYGIQISLSTDMSSPKNVGGLSTFDPLDPQVAAWWKSKFEEVYRAIPDFGGVVIKADSEGRPGPSQYGRTPADAANMMARALKPHGGLVLYRGFVYRHDLDWNDVKADRALAGYANFHQFDGQFDDNVIIQIKNGPIDFQVREPMSPLFTALPHTNEAIELEVSQEYTGQAHHLVYLAPQFKEELDTDMRASANAPPLPVKEIVNGHTFGPEHHTRGGFVGVVNAGLEGWMGHPLSVANIYAFGRLAWDPDQSAAAITDEWTMLTFGLDQMVRNVVNKLQLDSWHIYESYTGPLGVGTGTVVAKHYGPDIDSIEHDGWGQWWRANPDGIGVDRTVATGSGFTAQYPEPLAKLYDSVATCPEELLLFFHHLPYTYRLKSGKTLIQSVYDTHYLGAQAAAAQVPAWESLKGKIPDATYQEVLKRLEYQQGHAIVWRDSLTKYLAKMSSVPDEQNRVGSYPDRVEVEAMRLDGYNVVAVKPWESASEGKAVTCASGDCKAETTFDRPDGTYDVAVVYFDLNPGNAHFKLSINGREIEHWTGNENFPTTRPDGTSSVRITMRGVVLHHGDILRLIGSPDAKDPAALDYVEITPQRPLP